MQGLDDHRVGISRNIVANTLVESARGWRIPSTQQYAAAARQFDVIMVPICNGRPTSEQLLVALGRVLERLGLRLAPVYVRVLADHFRAVLNETN